MDVLRKIWDLGAKVITVPQVDLSAIVMLLLQAMMECFEFNSEQSYSVK